MPDDFNPYAAPEVSRSVDRPDSDSMGEPDVWRDGKVLVMAKTATLPGRCVKCNAPAARQLKRKLSWHNPAYYLLIIFPGLLIYVIIALIVRKTIKLEIPLCEEHLAKRRNAILLGWVLSLLGLGFCFAPTIDESYSPAVLVGILMFLFGLIYGVIGSQLLVPRKINATHAWLDKAGALYLATLPGFVDGVPGEL